MRIIRILPVALILATGVGFTGLASAAVNTGASGQSAAAYSGAARASAAKVSKKYCKEHPTDPRCEARR